MVMMIIRIIIATSARDTAHLHLVVEPSPSAGRVRVIILSDRPLLGCLAADCPALESFYHTQGHYPGPQLCFHAGLVSRAQGTSPQFEGVALIYPL